MSPRRLWLAAIVILSALAVSMVAVTHAGAAPCHHGTGLFAAPDNACTPGAYQALGRAAVCAPKDRPDLPIAERRRLLASYGVPGWTAANGEIDHRIPVFLGGLTVRRNLWPEPGPDPRRGQNPKDRLEQVIRGRVCGSVNRYLPARATMRVRTAVNVFRADWRAAFTYYVQGIGPRPTA